jgi:hypothetical protein
MQKTLDAGEAGIGIPVIAIAGSPAAAVNRRAIAVERRAQPSTDGHCGKPSQGFHSEKSKYLTANELFVAIAGGALVFRLKLARDK